MHIVWTLEVGAKHSFSMFIFALFCRFECLLVRHALSVDEEGSRAGSCCREQTQCGALSQGAHNWLLIYRSCSSNS
jgi:hypothetical protein